MLNLAYRIGCITIRQEPIWLKTFFRSYLRHSLPVCVQDVANVFFHSHQELEHREIFQKVSKNFEIVNKTCLRIIKHGALSLSVVERIVDIFSLQIIFDQSGPSFYFCWNLLLFWEKKLSTIHSTTESLRAVFRHVLFDNLKIFRTFCWICLYVLALSDCEKKH